MKKLTICLLLSLFLLQIGGLLLFYTIQQTAERFETWQQITEENGSFITIKTSIDAYKKGKQNKHEAVLNGKLYDIKSVTIIGDSIELLAFNDTEEEEIIRKINHLLSDLSNHTPNKTPQKFLKLFKSAAVCPTVTDLLESFYKDVAATERQCTPFKDKLLNGTEKPPLKPPPTPPMEGSLTS